MTRGNRNTKMYRYIAEIEREIQFGPAVSNLLIFRHCGSFLSSDSRASVHAASSRVFVYANALQAVISSHERWATAKPATNDTVRAIGPCPILEIRRRESSLRKRCVDASIMHTSFEKVAFFRATRHSALIRRNSDIYKRSLRGILKKRWLIKCASVYERATRKVAWRTRGIHNEYKL